MNIEFWKSFLAWSAVLNYAVLLIWFLFFVFGRDFVYRIHGRWFDLSPERFDAVHYLSMAVFKLLIFILNLVPYVVLCILS